MPGVKGNSGGKKGRSGRKSKAEELGLVATLEKCFSAEERETCIQKLVDDCKSDVFSERHEARKLLMAYTFGKPTEKHEHGGEGGGPITVKVVYETK